MAERVLTHDGADAYAAATPITHDEVLDLVAQVENYGIVQPGIDTYYRMLKALAV